MNALLDINNLHVHFALERGTIRAVDGVSLAIARGEVVALVGESGCGKSVLARSILQLIRLPGRITAGQIRYHRTPDDVIDLMALDPDAASLQHIRGGAIGLVWQEPLAALSPVHTIGAQLIEAHCLHHTATRGAARAAAVDLLQRLGFPRAAQQINAYPHQLSGGMRQRALIALALIGEPHLLIADEPTTALDAISAAQVLLALQEVQQQRGMALLFITHNLRLAARIADRIAIMYAGQLVEQAETPQVLNSPAHPYTEALVGSALRVGATYPQQAKLQGAIPDPLQRPAGCPFHPRCPVAVPGLCEQQEPPLVALATGQQVRCHLHSGYQS